MLFVCHPKFCISIVFSFPWGHFNSREKLKTMLIQNFGVTNKEYYGMLWYFWSGQFWGVRLTSGLTVISKLEHIRNLCVCGGSIIKPCLL